MTIEVRLARNFEDLKTMVGPKRPDANVCWCLSYRIPAKENSELRGLARGERVKQLVQEELPPGVCSPTTVLTLWGVGSGSSARRHELRPATAKFRTSTTSTCGRCGACACVPGIEGRGSLTT